MNSTDRFVVGYEQSALDVGVKLPVSIDFSVVPHLLIVAPSGSGKTHLLMLILKQLAQRDGKLILADFKGVDFIDLENCQQYYRHQNVAQALQFVFDELQNRMSHLRTTYRSLYFVVDEWSGFLSLYPKKEQETYKQQLASTLMLGRGVSIFVIVALQRADAVYLCGRDNFGNCIGLGSLSKESISMTFSEYKDLIVPKQRGHGYLQTDGKPLREIVVPKIRKPEKVMEIIKLPLGEMESL
mgnify:FL=1